MDSSIKKNADNHRHAHKYLHTYIYVSTNILLKDKPFLERININAYLKYNSKERGGPQLSTSPNENI